MVSTLQGRSGAEIYSIEECFIGRRRCAANGASRSRVQNASSMGSALRPARWLEEEDRKDGQYVAKAPSEARKLKGRVARVGLATLRHRLDAAGGSKAGDTVGIGPRSPSSSRSAEPRRSRAA